MWVQGVHFLFVCHWRPAPSVGGLVRQCDRTARVASYPWHPKIQNSMFCI